MLLMNEDRAVLQFSLDDITLQVLDNEFLPYQLKDWLKDTDFSTVEGMKRSVYQFDVFKDFLLGRLLSFSRENVKAILNSISGTQSSSIAEKLKLVVMCRALTMIDNFWIKEEEENITFSQVNLRKVKLGDAAFSIAIDGKVISATNSVLDPEITTSGMFAKTWYRGEEGIQLWKTDKTPEKVNTKAEVMVSQFLDDIGVSHVRYEYKKVNEVLLAVCDSISSDDVSLVTAQAVRDWCRHIGKDFYEWLFASYKQDFEQMVAIDYIIANTDRHWENWGFLVDNKTNCIIQMAPLYDHNQALIADYFGTEIDDLIYEPLNCTMWESVQKIEVSLRTPSCFPTQQTEERWKKISKI